MVDRKAYYDKIIEKIRFVNDDTVILNSIIPNDIVYYMKLDLETMKTINNNMSFSLHIDRKTEDSNKSYDIFSSKNSSDNLSYTISIIDNENNTKKIYHRIGKNYYNIYSERDQEFAGISCCMVKSTLDGMYVMFYNRFGAIIKYFNQESTEIIGNLDTDISILAETHKYSLQSDGEVTIHRDLSSTQDCINLFENIEEEFSNERTRIELKREKRHD